jgi:hypothetical protein
MNSNGGMLAARDGAFRYAFLDADFFRLKVLQRRPNETFTAAAIAAPARVVANGQTFASYCLLPGDCSVKWQGEVVSRYVVIPGDPAHAPLFRYFGQSAGASADSYRIAKGDPGKAVPPLAEALGRLLPLVDSRAIAATPASTGTFWTRPPTTGKVAYGIATDINAVLVIVQQDGEKGLALRDFAALIADAGIDQAVMGDGSDSAVLVVDRTVEVTPGHYIKDRSIPNGPSFIQGGLGLTSGAVRNNPASTDPRFLTSFSATGVQGALELDNSGIKLQIVSLGIRTDTGHDLANDLAIEVPIVLHAAEAQLPPPSAPLKSGPVTLLATMTRVPGTGGVLKGQMNIVTIRGSVVLDVDWPLSPT